MADGFRENFFNPNLSIVSKIQAGKNLVFFKVLEMRSEGGQVRDKYIEWDRGE